MKECFKCNQSLPLSEFYKHPAMGDGHLGKCKSCTKKDVRKRVLIKKEDPSWLFKERERNRKKAKEYRETGVALKPTKEQKRIINLRHKEKYPEKTKARNILSNALRDGKIHRHPCCECGAKAEGHHEDYSKPLEVIWLCPKHHAERHNRKREQEILKKFAE